MKMLFTIDLYTILGGDPNIKNNAIFRLSLKFAVKWYATIYIYMNTFIYYALLE